MTSMHPTRSMSSRRQLVLEFIRRHFRAAGASPSHAEIAGATGLRPQHVGRWLVELRDAGLITFTRRQPRSIALVDRLAMHSDLELELACHARGWTIVRPVPSVAPLAEVYPLDPDVTDLGLTLLDAIKHIE